MPQTRALKDICKLVISPCVAKRKTPKLDRQIETISYFKGFLFSLKHIYIRTRVGPKYVSTVAMAAFEN